MKKLAIIGASYLQVPLIEKAKSMNIETHVFAWEVGDVGEKIADFFYPISIIDKDIILEKCREICVDGICTIASDLAVITVNYVADRLGLIGNSLDATRYSTNKNSMRKQFELNGDPSPKSLLVYSPNDLKDINLHYPVIVKPVDRSGSRGITKLENESGLIEAVEVAKEQGFTKAALVEEYVLGQEYSVEYISYNGKHEFLALTKKFTTGAPHFIETGHIQPAAVNEETLERIKAVITHALDSLQITNGASHSEIKINGDEIRLIEIGGRMGGDFIGSHMVKITTGVDFVKAVIQIALGDEPDLSIMNKPMAAGVRFVFDENDINIFNKIKLEHPEYIVEYDIHNIDSCPVTDSGSRHGYYLLQANNLTDIMNYMPNEGTDQ